MNSLLANDEEQIHHQLVELGGGVVVGEQGEVVLAEHAETVHTQLVDKIHHLRHRLRQLLLQLTHHLNNIIIPEHRLHPHHNLPHYQKHILLYLNIHCFK